jgi:hypothetical protein
MKHLGANRHQGDSRAGEPEGNRGDFARSPGPGALEHTGLTLSLTQRGSTYTPN